uniref:Nuclear pore complex protein Nup160 homolog n=1 Tax=Trichuris muris TaxID=70415 RepID=A0A5S6QGH8_TRIMR
MGQIPNEDSMKMIRRRRNAVQVAPPQTVSRASLIIPEQCRRYRIEEQFLLYGFEDTLRNAGYDKSLQVLSAYGTKSVLCGRIQSFVRSLRLRLDLWRRCGDRSCRQLRISMHLICCSEGFRRDGAELILGGSRAVCTLAELKCNPTSGCFSYGSGLTDADERFKHRFIMWRALGQDLLLEERSFSEDISHGSLCLRFPNEVVLRGTNIFETGERLYLLVATTAAVYRIVLKHPRLEVSELRGASVLSTLREVTLKNPHYSFDYSCPTSEPPYASACAITKNEEAVFALAVEDNCILIVRFGPYKSTDPPSQEILWQSSRFKQLWNGLRISWSPSESFCMESATSLCFVNPDSELTLCALSFDRKLRLWSCKQRCVLVQFDFNEALSVLDASLSAPPSWMDGSKWRIKCFPVGSSVCFVAYVCIGNVSRFYVLRGEKVNRKWAINLITNFEAFNYDLIDFHLAESRFFGLWATRRGFEVKYKLLSVGPTCRQSVWMDMQGLDDILVQSDVKLNLKQLVNKTFSPVQFSFDSLQKALRLCCLNMSVDVKPGDREALRLVALRYVVESNYVNEKDLVNLFSEGGSGKVTDNHRLQVARFFTNLWKNCIQYHHLAMQPLGFLFQSSSAFAGIITHDRIVAMVDMKSSYSGLALPPVVGSVHDVSDGDFMECLQLINAAIRLAQEDDDPNLLCTKPWLVASTEASALISNENDKTSGCLRRAIFNNENLFFACLSRMMDVDPFGRPLNGNASGRGATVPPPLSRLAFDMLAAAVRAFVDEKLAFYRAVLCLIAFWTSYRSVSHLANDAWSKIEGEITQRVTTLCRCYAILRWISKLSLQEHSKSALLFLSGVGVSVMSICCYNVWNKPELRDQLLDSLHEQSVNADEQFGRMFPRLVLSVVVILWPENGCLPVFDCLFAQQQYCAMERLGNMLEPWCQPAFGLRLFYVAGALLRMRRFDAALDYFNRAYGGVAVDEPQLSGKLQLSFDHPRIVMYYLKVAELFAEEDCPEMSIRCCRSALQVEECDDDCRATLCSKIFAYHLKMGDYENALQVALENPDHQLSEKCLTTLLDTMVDRERLTDIVDFIYDDLEPCFICYMEDNARLPNSRSVVHYNVLYAYFIRRLNYRRAAFYAYEKARSVAGRNEHFCPNLREERINALTATAAALSSIKAPYSWVEVYELQANTNKIDEGSLKLISLKEVQRELILAVVSHIADRSMNSLEPTEADQLVTLLVDQDKHELAETLITLHSIPPAKFLCSVALMEAKQARYSPQGGPIFQKGSKWSLLQLYLQRYSSDPEIGSLYAEVIKSLLERGFSPPAWLFDHFRKADAYQLLLFLFEYGRHREAVDLVEWMCNTALSTRCDDETSSDVGTCLPNLFIDNLLLVLEENSDNERNLLLAKTLRSTVASYYDAIGSDVVE